MMGKLFSTKIVEGGGEAGGEERGEILYSAYFLVFK